MNEFLTGEELENAVYNIIWEAKNTLLIVSPYVKLDNYFKELFDKHQNDPKIHLIIVFGKNEKNIKRSLSKSDFDYFKKFLNISIIYVPNLHAKYYGNEKQGVITSINLYDYSFKNNLEFGVYTQKNMINNLVNNATYNESWSKCMEIAENNEVVFIKRPVYDSKKIIIDIIKNYVKSDVLIDSTDKFYGYSRSKPSENKRLNEFPLELKLGSKQEHRPIRKNKDEDKYGYCIRTGKKIKFNPKKPMSKESWEIWNEYKNRDFPENYCHKTGVFSKGKTSMRKPIL